MLHKPILNTTKNILAEGIGKEVGHREELLTFATDAIMEKSDAVEFFQRI